MKQVTLNIPDSKFDFFMDLVRQLNLEKYEVEVIPDSHKSKVLKRIDEASTDDFQTWEEARASLKFRK